MMAQARLELDNYTLRVLDVVKGKYGLKNKTDALNKFFQLFGDQFIEPEFDEKETTILRDIVDSYETKGKKRKLTLKDVDKILGI